MLKGEKQAESGRDASPGGAASASVPTLTLPKGGGAIRGMGEKFAANPVTGTGSMNIPIATSPGRAGFGLQLSLSYDSGSGNGPFGFGWSLSLPQITRKTDKGLPRYHDVEESDVFILSGAEDLVPLLNPDGTRFEDEAFAPGYVIHRYRPRIEGLFARIERWTRTNDGDVHWRSISKDNILTLYGKDENSRILDPIDHSRVFTWLIDETRDDRGNAVVYEYKPEDGTGVDLSRAHEYNRGDLDDPRRKVNRYLKHIRYGNRVPLLDDAGQRPRLLTDAQIQNAGWMFEVVLDYGEHDADAPEPNDAGEWTYRADPFSSYRAGFEVRTGRLCQRVLMFHHFAGEPNVGENCLVRSTEFTYSYEQDPDSARNPIYTFLRAVTQIGYRRHNDRYLKRSLPSIEFGYTQPVVQDVVHQVDAASLENLPMGVDGTIYQWTDLHGEGIPGILTEQGEGWYYKLNLSPMHEGRVEFAPMQRVAIQPNVRLAGGQAQFMDLAGDGQLDLVMLDGPVPGLFEHDDVEGWLPFRPFTSRLNHDMRDPNLRFIDLDGDGHADVLISEHDAFVWHPSLGEAGFGPAHRVVQALDEEKGPRIVFADGTESIYLADLSGDGLTDLVRIRNGEVCYWPNLGYGRFGAKVMMDNAPWFDNPDQFDEKRIRLADIDGSGTVDIIYLHRDGVRLYFNQSGNGWSDAQDLPCFPSVDNLSSVMTADLLGNGTACLVWSSPLPGDAWGPMRYVDLMGGQKPHLLERVVNNLGAETRVKYAPSTKFYLLDKVAGKPWITRLPFPVHVVECVETYDHISGNRFVTRYAYHHGYFDGEEREFRGFGMVEQWDTERTNEEATHSDAGSYVPPVLTRTWFHTRAYLGGDRVSNHFAGLHDAQDRGEYYREPAWRDNDEEAKKRLLDDTILPDGLTIEEEREACRALKGMMLRQEVYALDGAGTGTGTEDYPYGHPYTVVEQNFTIKRLQPQEGNRHAVFFTHAREAITYHYERNPADPRISHALTLEVDDYGDVLKEISIGYGRRAASADPDLTDDDKAKQTQLLIMYTQNALTNAVLEADHYRTPLPAEARTYELTGFKLQNNAERFGFDEWLQNGFALLGSATEIPYEQTADNMTRQKRLIEQLRTRYRKDDMTALLPLGVMELLALPGETYRLAFTPGLVAWVFGHRLTLAMLEDDGRFVHSQGDANWWIPSGLVFFHEDTDAANPANTATQERSTARAHFYLPRKFVDPFANGTVIVYDAHDLLVTGTNDTLGNTVTATNDYRVLQPRQVTDPNRSRAEVAHDALGMVVGTAVMGKLDPDRVEGDSLEGFEADLSEAVMVEHLANPLTNPHTILARASTRLVYDLFAYQRTKDSPSPQPAVVYTLARETHHADLKDGEKTKVQHSFSYTDGFGREIQKKIQAEPGPDSLSQKPPAKSLQPRWVGSGWIVYNNKGKPVRKYEPFFSATHRFEFSKVAGVSSVLFYDPLDRVVATLHPNDTYEKVVFDPWRHTTYDVNDTVAKDPRTDPDIAGYMAAYFKTQSAEWTTWFAQRIGGGKGAAERDAAEKAAVHADTPTVAHLDALGRPIVTVAHNRYKRNGAEFDERVATRVSLDIEGIQRAVIDAQGRVVMRYDYDMLGSRIHQASMEAGEQWVLNDVVGKPIRAWDSRGFVRRMTYDELRRPTGLYVTENGVERLAERTVYGEGQGDAKNHRTRVYQVYDGAGIVTSEDYDFKGNLLKSRRDLLATYKDVVDWQQNPDAHDGSFTSSTTYDALNRPVSMTSPDGSVYHPTFNEANLLDKVDVNLRGAAVATPFVTNIDYNAKGQRERIDYGNGAQTTYDYDPLTFRLKHLKTTRPSGLNGPASQIFADSTVVQDLRYTYDPVGNLTRIEDAALKTVFHDNHQVDPVCRYTYDAVYRLIEAEGREHIGQTAFDFNPPDRNYRDYPFAGNRVHGNDLQALRTYTERYEYDVVGNFEKVIHRINGGGWTRRYEYQEDSLIEAGKKSNRLTRTRVGSGLDHTESYHHDAHGDMTSMPHLAAMVWDFEDQLQRVDLGGGGTAYYVYNASGERVRKVIESQNGLRRKERLYLGGFEIYREYNGTGADVMLERESLHVMDDKQRIALVETLVKQNGQAIDKPVPLQRYQLGNHLGSANVELAEDGALISYEEYHPYGTTAFQAGRSAAEVSLKRYRYTGKERDKETGFCYHGARYYAPWLGRWTAADPLGLVDGTTIYTYVRSNPLGLMDPSGMQASLAVKAYQAGVRATEAIKKADEGIRFEQNRWAQLLSQRNQTGTIVTPEELMLHHLTLKVFSESKESLLRSRQSVAREVGRNLSERTFGRGKPLFDHNHPDAATHIANILVAAWDRGITDRAQVAYMIATADHESKLGQSMSEKRPNDRTSGKYRGRGYVQISELKSNVEIVNGEERPKQNSLYRTFAKLTGEDLVSNPDRAADSNVAAKILVIGLTEKPLRGAKTIIDYGVKEGAKDLAFAFWQARRVVQGGYETELQKDIGHDIKRQALRIYEALR